jgi:HlyD family secretion protein
VVAKLDLSDFKQQVDGMRIQVQLSENHLEQARRQGEQNVAAAKLEVENTIRSQEILHRSQKTEIQQAEAQIGYNEWDLKRAQVEYDKQKRLLAAGIVPASAVESAEQALRNATRQLEDAKKQITYLEKNHASVRAQEAADIEAVKFKITQAEQKAEQELTNQRQQNLAMKSELARLERQLALGNLVAPQAGLAVISTMPQSPSKLKVGDNVWGHQPIVEIADISKMDVALEIEDTAVGQLKVGQEAVIRPIGMEEKEFKGKLTRISAVARRLSPWENPDAPPDQRVFDVTVTIFNPDVELLRPGMKAKVQVVFEKLLAVLHIPREAVFNKNEGKVVYVASEGGFEARPVEVGGKNDEEIVITRGLSPGEHVALSDPTRTEKEP